MVKARDINPKPVTINLGGKQRELLFDLNAFCVLEDLYGSIEGARALFDQKPNLKTIRILTAAALASDESGDFEDESGNISIKKVARVVTLENLGEVTEKVMEAFKNAMPLPSEDPTKTLAQE